MNKKEVTIFPNPQGHTQPSILNQGSMKAELGFIFQNAEMETTVLLSSLKLLGSAMLPLFSQFIIPDASQLTSSSVFCFLATTPVFRASLLPPLRLPTWVKGQKTATVIRAWELQGECCPLYNGIGSPSIRSSQLAITPVSLYRAAERYLHRCARRVKGHLSSVHQYICTVKPKH